MNRPRQPINLTILLVAVSTLFVFTATPARADGGAFGEGRYFGLRLSLALGAFYYPQVVDGGYYIDGQAYDLTWYGLQGQLSGEAYAFVPWAPSFTVGLGGSYFRGLFPRAMDPNSGATEDGDGSAPGGYGGLTGAWLLGERGRISLLLGYGGTGVQDQYGGFGPAFSVSAAFVRPLESVFGGLFGQLGVRFTYMHLNSGGDADTRGEQGGYMAMLVEGSLDWAPRLGAAASESVSESGSVD